MTITRTSVTGVPRRTSSTQVCGIRVPAQETARTLQKTAQTNQCKMLRGIMYLPSFSGRPCVDNQTARVGFTLEMYAQWPIQVAL
jgi:hypothetical protein